MHDASSSGNSSTQSQIWSLILRLIGLRHMGEYLISSPEKSESMISTLTSSPAQVLFLHAWMRNEVSFWALKGCIAY